MEQVYQRERLMAQLGEKTETPDDASSNYPDLWDDSEEEEESKSQKKDLIDGLEKLGFANGFGMHGSK